MKKTLLVMMALAGAVPAAQSPVLSPEQTMTRRAIGDLEFSPDHSRLVFTVTEPVKGSARQRNVWMLDVASGRSRQLTYSAKSDSSPRWAPDGRAIAFLSDRDGAAQLYLLPMAGGEAAKITDRKESISAFRWSPDGTPLALLMTEPKPEAQLKRERDKDDSRVAEKDDRQPRIWTVVSKPRFPARRSSTWPASSAPRTARPTTSGSTERRTKNSTASSRVRR